MCHPVHAPQRRDGWVNKFVNFRENVKRVVRNAECPRATRVQQHDVGAVVVDDAAVLDFEMEVLRDRVVHESSFLTPF